MSRGQLIDLGVSQVTELNIYPPTTTGKILTAKQEFDSAFRKENLCWQGERERG